MSDDDVPEDELEEGEDAEEAALNDKGESGPRPARGEEGEDDEEPDPDDVEADLDAILKDRIAAGDDEDEEDDEGAPGTPGGDDQVAARQDTEMACPHCFLLVQAATVAETGECGHCGGPLT